MAFGKLGAMGRGFGTLGVLGTVGYSVAAQQFLARLNSDPGTTDKRRLARVIDRLVAASIWTKIDALWLPQNTQANSLINLKSSSFSLILAGSSVPTFVAYQGFTGTGSGYIRTQFNPATAGGNYSRDSASFGYYCRNNRTVGADIQIAGFTDAGPTNASIDITPLFTDGKWYGRMNEALSGNINVPSFTTTQGQVVFSRTGSLLLSVRRNEAELTAASSGSLNSVAVPNGEIYLLARNANGAATHFSSDTISAAFFGGGLANPEMDFIANCVNQYMAST